MTTLTDEALSAALAEEVASRESGTAQRRWFYTQDGEQYGPVTGPELCAAARLGFLDHRSRVRRGRDGDWGRARNIRGLLDGGRRPHDP